MRSALLILLLAASRPVRAEELLSPFPSVNEAGVFSLLEENDKFSFNNRDRYYTQGLRLVVNHENGFYAALTQEINTPADTVTANPPLDDLPYSAALYFSYGHGRVLERGGRRDVLFVWELQLGVVGPAAGGPTIQNSVHRLIGVPVSSGWQTQQPNEIVANLNLDFRKRFDLPGGRPGLRDLIVRAGAELGTIRTEFIVGGQIRWGRGLGRSWGNTTFRQSPAFDPVARLRGELTDPPVAAWFFADAQVEVVVSNYATDGGNFRASRGVPREPIVGQFSLGYSFQFHRVATTLYTSVRTHEFAAQRSMHGVGGIKLDLLF
ncbi:MAG: lipid A deacylase LpxR family protein [Opitutia bacterium]